MKNLKMIISFLLLIGAGIVYCEMAEDRMLMTYYTDYKKIVSEELGEPVPDASYISIKFSVLPKNIIGRAYGMFENDTIDIRISRNFWQQMDDNTRRVFMYHELSHDVHRQTHCANNECIMFPSKSGMKITDADQMLRTAINEHHKCKQLQRFFFFGPINEYN